MADAEREFLQALDRSRAERDRLPTGARRGGAEASINRWSAADRLSDLDDAVYKHAVLGLPFLQFVSDSFALRQRGIEAQLRDLQSDCFLNPVAYGGKAARNTSKQSVPSWRSATTTARRTSSGCRRSPDGMARN